MRKLFLLLFVSIMTIGIFMADAEAARFGGGRSFGMSRLAQPSTAFNAGNVGRSFQNTAAAPRQGMGKWLGPLAGFAAGGLLASLFMGHGVGTGILSWLLIGGLAFFVWRLISSRLQPASQPSAPMNNAYQYQPASNSSSSAFHPEVVVNNTRPLGFDEAAFLRQAKTVFIRLQADYDTKNTADIREFTTPEVFAEIQMQLQERGDAPNQTEVVSINADLQEVTVETQGTVASVLFSGLVREQMGSEPSAIKEIWHFIKPENSQNWLVAGIQQP